MSEGPKPRTKRLLVYLFGVTCAVAAVVVFLCSSPVQIRYNEWRMRRAWNDVYGKPADAHHNGLSGYTLGTSYDQYTYHRQRLVALGAVREVHYRLRHVSSSTNASQHLIKLLLQGNCPDLIDFESPHADKPEPLELTVWCFTPDANAWDRFIAEHDIPDAARP